MVGTETLTRVPVAVIYDLALTQHSGSYGDRVGVDFFCFRGHRDRFIRPARTELAPVGV